MEIERDALLRVVKATRMAMKLAEDTQKLFMDNGQWTVADEIAGRLQDALFQMSHDKADCPFNKSTTMQVLTSGLDDEAATDWFRMMYRMSERLHGMEPEKEPEQPKPQTIKQEDAYEMYLQNGGYKAPIPEDERK